MSDFAVFENFTGNPILFEDEDVCAVGFSCGRFEVEDGTTFMAVGSGSVSVGDYLVDMGMYACVPAPSVFTSCGCGAMLVTAKRYKGIFMLGGPLEASGRLRYINGCTDTGLIQPIRLGDPCLNYLHFPALTRQDAHHHPSHRIGLIYGGQGWCHTDRMTPLRPGGIFVIPTGATHWFETGSGDLRIVAFHPNSEFGPTDESHQMLNATLTGGV